MFQLAAAVPTDSSCLFAATLVMLAAGAIASSLLGMALDTDDPMSLRDRSRDEPPEWW